MKKKIIIVLLVISAICISCLQEKNIVTVTPTIDLTQTPEAFITSTPITSPTLSKGDAEIRFLDLLSNNGKCNLPCLWGIIPGKSNYKEAENILRQLSLLSKFVDFGNEGGSLAPVYLEGNSWLRANVGFNTNSTSQSDQLIVSRVGLWLRRLEEIKLNNDVVFNPVFDSEIFSQQVNYYTLSNTLSIQGSPTSASISVQNGQESKMDIVLLYPELGIFVNYTTQLIINGNKFKGCFQNAHIKLELYPSGSPSNFLAELEISGSEFVLYRDSFKSIEEAISMSIEEFYETFRIPTDKCIETPANIWLPH
jgi:hypothetical protein